METFNKKTLLERYKKVYESPVELDEEEINELVNDDGSPIGGASTGYDDNEIRVSPGQTTDSYAKSARQGPRPYFGYYGTAYSHGAMRHVGVFTEDEENSIEEETVLPDGMTVAEYQDKMNETANEKMENLLEKVLTIKNSDTDIVDKTKKDLESIKKEIKDIFDKHKDDKSEILIALDKLETKLNE